MKTERIKNQFKHFYRDLDNIFLLFQIKIYLISLLNDINLLRAINEYRGELNVRNAASKKVLFTLNIKAEDLKSSHKKMENEMRRIYISDLYLISARHCIFIRSILDDKKISDPAFIEKKIDMAINLLNPFLFKDDKLFLYFFRKIRNSIVHYDGNHNQSNQLDYKFCEIEFKTTKKNIGTQIIWRIEELIELYKRLKRIFDYSKISKNTHFQKLTRPI